jgi:hypothetical protein
VDAVLRKRQASSGDDRKVEGVRGTAHPEAARGTSCGRSASASSR